MVKDRMDVLGYCASGSGMGCRFLWEALAVIVQVIMDVVNPRSWTRG